MTHPASPSRPLRTVRASAPQTVQVLPRRDTGETCAGLSWLSVEGPGPNGQPVTRLAYPYSRRFECRAGRLFISRLGIPLADDVWAQAQTAHGVTLYANFKRTDTGARLTMPLWAHAAGARAAGTRHAPAAGSDIRVGGCASGATSAPSVGGKPCVATATAWRR